jgi:hypothetical protein
VTAGIGVAGGFVLSTERGGFEARSSELESLASLVCAEGLNSTELKQRALHTTPSVP